jgi:hypothetical protein
MPLVRSGLCEFVRLVLFEFVECGAVTAQR